MNGAIAFDSPDDSPQAQQNTDYHLYEDLAHSQRGEAVELNFSSAQADVRLYAGYVPEAALYPEYVNTFARAGTRFSVITPQISAAGVEHLDTLFQAYINVEPGRGAPRRDFEIQETTISDSRYIDGLSIIVEVPEAGSLGIGTPVLFRGLEVGTVTGLMLGSMSDRVMVQLRISKRYQYLVRNNSVFWLASGYSLDFGLIGGVVKTGTFNQFIRGGIAFATPPGTPLAPKAQDGKHFLLLESEPKEWREWGTALPR